MTEKKKGGAPRKGAEGLTKALHIAAEPGLVEGIDAIKDRRKAATPGVRLSRADVVRSILWDAVRLNERTPRDAAHTTRKVAK